MGITGLIPFLEKASSCINIEQLHGSTVAVDSYCWLHKGVFACAEKLIRGETTDIHIQYCLKYIDMLRAHKINIIMVFDGRHLPAKAETERRRREARNESKRLAKEYLRMNEIEKARSHMRRAVDVTHEMALELIKACRNRGIDCIVAPYEADAQMAWMNKKGLAEYIVTEDSDLTLFGAQKILFKLDLAGRALLVESNKLYMAMGCKPEKYTFDKFRRMCILSGCDYLDSLQGIGLKKACKFILTTEEDDITKALKKIPSYLKMKQLVVTNEYIDSFLKAEATFRHMFVYNPLERRMERLNELEDFQTNEIYCSNAGSLLDDEELAFQLAIGNLNPFTLKKLDDWHPDRNCSQLIRKHKSIWQSSRNVKEIGDNKKQVKQICESSVLQFKKIEYKNMAEIERDEKSSEEKSKLEESEIYTMYKYASPKMERKRKRQSSSPTSSEDEYSENLSHISKKGVYNPFSKIVTTLENTQKPPVCTSNSFLKLLSPKKINVDCLKQQISSSNKTSVKSRFFAENIKEVVKNSFTARDLTSQMCEIEEKTITYMDQKKALYCVSPQFAKMKCQEDERQKCVEDDEVKMSESKKLVFFKETMETAKHDSKNCISNVNGDEVILPFNNKEKQLTQNSSSSQPSKVFTKKKLETIPRKSSKFLESGDSKQSKLSMFGFQKRPLLKKF